MKGLTRIFRGPRATNTPRQTPLRTNADRFATSSPFSGFFAEVVCDLGTTPPQVTAAPPPIGGNCTTRGFDTPATRREKASCSAKPPSQPPEVRRVAYKYWAQGRLARKTSPNTSPPVTFPRKSSPSKRKNTEFGPI